MTGTDSNNSNITLNNLLKKTHSTVAKANAAAAPSVPSTNAATAPSASSAKAIMYGDDVTLATLDALKKKSTKKDSDNLFGTDDKIPKKKSTKKKRYPVDLDNPGLYDIKDDDTAEKEKE